MNIVQETLTIRKQLSVWAADPEWSLMTRYDLLCKKKTQSLSDKLLRWIRGVLAGLRLIRPHVSTYSWLPTLKHSQPDTEVTTLLIWAYGCERDDLHNVCDGFLQRLDRHPGLVPVLVTDVADFAYFSRLKWLVEYLPELSGENQSYRERKQRYLAWRYREALIVHASAGRANSEEWEHLLKV